MSAGRWRATCRGIRCEWSTEGSRAWCDKAVERHRAEHRARREQKEQARERRYRWRGRPNPTQVRLLEEVSAGTIHAHRTTVWVVRPGSGDTSSEVWYASGLRGPRMLYWPALVQAGLVRARPTFRDRDGVWLLTDAGREVLEKARQKVDTSTGDR